MNLLITGAWQQARDHIEKIRRQGHSVIFLQYERDELPCDYGWVEGVICSSLFLEHPIEKFVNLKYIQLTSAGLDRVPMEYVREHGIVIHNAHGVYSIPMAEFVIGGVLQLYKQAKFFTKNQMEHCWTKHRGLRELYGKTVCIAGCGSVGCECAKRFRAFGCRVIGVNRTVRQNEYFEKIAGLEELDQILADTDILVLAVPLTKETYHLIDEKKLVLMKEGAILVNVSRGAVVEEQALIGALSGRLAGAALDVFEEEPPDESSPLWDMEHVILTPHNSFVGEENAKRLENTILKNIGHIKEE